MLNKFIKYCLLVTVHVTLSAFAKLTQSPGVKLVPNLDAPESLIEPLAENICYDLEIYRNESNPLSHEQCLQNFIRPSEVMSHMPPTLRLRCRWHSAIGYSVTHHGERMPLVVFTTDNATLLKLPYEFPMSPNEVFRTININPGRYKSWITLLNHDGSHSYWRRGPDVDSWNVTGETRPKNYVIQVEYQTDNDKPGVQAKFTWNSYDDEDVCFNFVNQCDGWSTKSISPSMKQSYVLSGLPLKTNCTVTLSGKYGDTSFAYRTPSSSRLPKCVKYEKVQNLTVNAMAAAGSAGWDVAASWGHPCARPRRYNVTIFTENLIQSIDVPGNETSTIFLGVEDAGFYDVAVGAVYERRTAYTSVGETFPDLEEVNNLTVSASAAADGGGWDLTARWLAPRTRARRYNVTLLSQNLSTSLEVLWNETSATFKGVKDGSYDVTVGAVYDTTTVYKNIGVMVSGQ